MSQYLLSIVCLYRQRTDTICDYVGYRHVVRFFFQYYASSGLVNIRLYLRVAISRCI